ncbi:MAG: sulfite exporter TauE/SafE family protein [Oscillospiraceae bacterium]|nr:sulfite exporter TauE/SafE family protein [Oscillospiraceae bacterium]MCL2248340.1 sulfite exporter TauE/SafE family protein [Oscillospiraceae bacterium]
MIGLIYSIVILLACIIAAIVGLGGAVFFRPIFDAIDYHSFNEIQLFSSVAIVTMTLVSTIKKIKDGMKIDMPLAVTISIGAIVGGLIGDFILEYMQAIMVSSRSVQLAQTVSTIIVLSVAIFLTLKKDFRYEVKSKVLPPLMGLGLGMVAVFLGIGGGPLNVPLFMIFLRLAPKSATAYSLVIIFFTHASRLVRLGIASEFFAGYDIGILPLIIAAAAVGGLLGAIISVSLSENAVKKMFVGALIAVILLNAFNGLQWVIHT